MDDATLEEQLQQEWAEEAEAQGDDDDGEWGGRGRESERGRQSVGWDDTIPWLWLGGMWVLLV